MPTFVILDNTVLSNFALTSRVEWLRIYPVPIATTRLAWDELDQGIKSKRIPPRNWDWLTILDLDEESQRRYMELKPPLGAGEAACLAVAWTQNCQVATDDKRARQKARELGISATGTLGVLVQLVESGQVPLSEANQALSEMLALGYRSPFNQIDPLIATHVR